MLAKLKIMTVACLLTLYGISLNSQMVHAQDAENNKITEQTTIEEQAPTRSPWLAVGLSLGSTLVLSGIGTGLYLGGDSGGAQWTGVGFLALGTVIAPSVGQLYSERWVRATAFTLGRAAVVGISTAIIVAEWNNDSWLPSNSPVAVACVGMAVLSGLAIWDIVDSYSSAKQFNEEHAKKSISVSPFIMPSRSRNGENGTAYGLAVAGNF